jgi:AcrR family transcriptional regulator
MTSRRELTKTRRAAARDRIVTAAERLLQTRDFRDLTVDDVMADAGLSRTVFYRHFDGLPQVVLALLDRIEADLEEQIPPGPADEQWMQTMLTIAVNVFADHARFLRALDDAAAHDAEIEHAWRAFVIRWVDETAALLPPTPECYELARALNLMNVQYLMETLGHDPSFDRTLAQNTLLTVWSAVARSLSE